MATIACPYFMGNPMPGFDVPEPHINLAPALPGGSEQERMAVLYRELRDLVACDDVPVVWAGDCLSIIGVLAGLQECEVEPTIVFFDAHGDFNTWDTTPSGFLGGMPLAMVTGRGERTIIDSVGLTPLEDNRVVLVDARDLDDGEDGLIAGSGIVVTTVESVTEAIPGEGPIYVHVDLDVVDPSEMPAMNYPAPGGPTLRLVADAVAALAATGRVVAFSLSSWNPALPDAEKAAAAARVVAAPFLSGNSIGSTATSPS